MPWTIRARRSSRARLRNDLRRWRYDHSQDLRAFGIGAAVVTTALLVVAAARLLLP